MNGFFFGIMIPLRIRPSVSFFKFNSMILTFQFLLVDFCGVMKMNCPVSSWIYQESVEEMIMMIHGVMMTGVNF